MIVAIVGPGQIGGSLSAAIAARGLGRTVELDRGDDLDDLRLADVTVLATPAKELLRILPDVVRRLRPGTVLTDVASVKGPVVAAYRKCRRRDITFVPGHPMAGTEDRSTRDPELFAGRPWFLIGGDARVEAIVRGVGARPEILRDAARHDRLVAAISHLPHAIAAALAATAGPSADLAGGSYRDATRVLLSDPRVVADFLSLNRKALKESIDAFCRHLKRLPDLHPEELESLWSRLGERRRERGPKDQ